MLGKRSDQIANLVINANALLAELLTQRNAVDALMTNVAADASDIALVSDNRTQLKPALDKLNGVLSILDNRKKELQRTLSSLGHTRCRSAKCWGPGRSSKPPWST